MIIVKDIQTRVCEILTDAKFNVVASEITEGFQKPAMFVSAFPVSYKLNCCGGATEEVSISIEIKYISALETVEDCVNIANRLKELFLYPPFEISDRRLTVEEIEFDIEKGVLYTYFDLTFNQRIERNEEYEEMSELQIGGVL